MATPWEAEHAEEFWSDREAWRGDCYPDAGESWVNEEVTTPVVSAEEEHDGDIWRAAFQGGHWPEELAGPEYWMYKRMRRDPPG